MRAFVAQTFFNLAARRAPFSTIYLYNSAAITAAEQASVNRLTVQWTGDAPSKLRIRWLRRWLKTVVDTAKVSCC